MRNNCSGEGRLSQRRAPRSPFQWRTFSTRNPLRIVNELAEEMFEQESDRGRLSLGLTGNGQRSPHNFYFDELLHPLGSQLAQDIAEQGAVSAADLDRKRAVEAACG